jgi:dihydrofolate reductase
MRKLMVFNNVSLDGYIADSEGSMRWAARQDPQWNEFASENSRGDAVVMLFGRVTYDLMVSFWPTPAAAQAMPVVAKRMNEAAKIVFSRTMKEATWQNTTLLKTDPVEAVRKLKSEAGPDMLLMGSGSIIAQLTAARLIDEYQIVLIPVVLGRGLTMFAGLKEPCDLQLNKTRTFDNGNVVLWYSLRS